jgi:3-keto-5-aminohexanoate cleavage enzyme
MTDPRPLIINLAHTGMVPTKEMTPHVPIEPDEIIEDVSACIELGVTMVHIHARDDQGVPSHRAEHFEPIVAGLRRAHPDVVLCVTCSGRFVQDLDARAQVLDLEGEAKPDMASLTIGSNNFPRSASVNPPDVIEGLASRMRTRGIKPELEVFEPGMVTYARYLVERGHIAAPCYVNILLGNIATSPLEASVVSAFLSLVPDDWTWGVAGIGRVQLDANVLGMALGGHVRVGLEDNVWWDRARTELATNQQLVRRIVEIAERLERPLASPQWTRQTLGL